MAHWNGAMWVGTRCSGAVKMTVASGYWDSTMCIGDGSVAGIKLSLHASLLRDAASRLLGAPDTFSLMKSSNPSSVPTGAAGWGFFVPPAMFCFMSSSNDRSRLFSCIITSLNSFCAACLSACSQSTVLCKQRDSHITLQPAKVMTK